MRASLPLFGLLLATTLTTTPRRSLAQCQLETFNGRVVAVMDGDTVSVLREGREVKIRLHGVDTPESSLAFGDVAKRFTSDRVFGKTVTVRVMDTDRYGRLFGVVSSREGDSLNEALVKNGYAWRYHQYGSTERKLAEAEIDARVAPWTLEGPRSYATLGVSPSGAGSIERRRGSGGIRCQFTTDGW